MNTGINKQALMHALWQGVAIFFIVVTIAILVNQCRTNRLALKTDWSLQAQLANEPAQVTVISLEKARQAFFSKKAVFLDARPAELFDQGHIPGALNLPWEAVDKYLHEAMAKFPKGTMIITYCDGEGCSLGRDLARDLFFRGYDNVHVLEDGWSRWVGAGLPVAKGGSGRPVG